MLTIVFGTRTESVNDDFVKQALRLSREFMNCTGPVSNLVDFITPLQWIPTPMRNRGRKLHQGLADTYGGMIKNIEARVNAGQKAPDCLAKTILEIRQAEGLDDLDMAILTPQCALIPAYPEIQKKAQEELNRVVGRDRLPTVEDENDLLYYHAIIKEVERMHNPFWLGTPHSLPRTLCTRDSLSRRIPYWCNPYERDYWVFGVGRRICPGIIVAEREIWLTISRMLWAFNMYEIPGEPIDLNEYDGLSGRSSSLVTLTSETSLEWSKWKLSSNASAAILAVASIPEASVANND